MLPCRLEARIRYEFNAAGHDARLLHLYLQLEMRGDAALVTPSAMPARFAAEPRRPPPAFSGASQQFGFTFMPLLSPRLPAIPQRYGKLSEMPPAYRDITFILYAQVISLIS